METIPSISVLLPVHNGGEYLKPAIESILNQTFSDLELLIINDGSTDDSELTIKSFNDSRINYIKNEKNLGLIESLNKGIKLCKGKYIARMDADDISLPTRLKKQFCFMESQPHIGICGSDYITFSESWKKKVKSYSDSDEMKTILLFGTSLCHPAVMIKKEILIANNFEFSADYKHAEDYELWTRMAMVTNFSNINDVLFYYRHHNKQVSNQYQDIQLQKSNQIRKNYLSSLGFSFSESELLFHNLVGSNKRIVSKNELKGIEDWFKHLINQNKAKQIIPTIAFTKIIGKMWLDSCGNTSLGLSAFFYFRNSSLQKTTPSIGILSLGKLFIKCILRKGTN